MKQDNFAQSMPGHAANYLPKSARAQEILALRAKILAEKKVTKAEDLAPNHYLRFGLGKEHSFGIDFDHVLEVIRYSHITSLPLAPNFVSGVINYRGHLIAVIDLSLLFSLTTAKASHTHIIVVDINHITVGLITHSIDNSISYDASSLEPPLAANNRLKKNYVYGLHNGTVAILNIAAVIEDFNLAMKIKVSLE